MRKEVPLIITFLAGAFFIADYFIPHTGFSRIAEIINGWTIIVIAFSYVLGVANVARVNLDYVQRRGKDTPYKVILLICLAFMMTVGLIGGLGEGTIFDWFFINVYTPMQAMMFALLAFYIASAAFRAFRIRSPQAALLAIPAVLVMIARVPIGEAIWKDFSNFAE